MKNRDFIILTVFIFLGLGLLSSVTDSQKLTGLVTNEAVEVQVCDNSVCLDRNNIKEEYGVIKNNNCPVKIYRCSSPGCFDGYCAKKIQMGQYPIDGIYNIIGLVISSTVRDDGSTKINLYKNLNQREEKEKIFLKKGETKKIRDLKITNINGEKLRIIIEGYEFMYLGNNIIFSGKEIVLKEINPSYVILSINGGEKIVNIKISTFIEEINRVVVVSEVNTVKGYAVIRFAPTQTTELK